MSAAAGTLARIGPDRWRITMRWWDGNKLARVVHGTRADAYQARQVLADARAAHRPAPMFPRPDRPTLTPAGRARVGSVHRLPSGRWVARYRGVSRCAPTKRDAEALLARLVTGDVPLPRSTHRLGTGAPRPFPWAPLAAIVGPGTAAEVAEQLGIQARQLYRLAASGLTVDEADRLACRLGFHPALVWPEWFAAEILELDDVDLVDELERVAA